jgi:Zn-dependent protease with chaperone function
MMWPQLQTVAQIAIAHVLNSLPEGLLVAAFAWVMLCILPRQNSGTRFAVWFVALLAVAGLPFVGGVANHSFVPPGVIRPMVTLSRTSGVLLFLAWILAAGVAMARLANGLWHLRRLRRSCTAIALPDLDVSLRETVAGFSSPGNSILGFAMRRSVTLALSEQVSVPAAIGFFTPMIVLPAWALRELPPEELKIVLLHEFAHLRRRDDWTNLLQKIVRAVFLFHPAVWWIENQLSLEREMACDDVVLAETANPRGYAKCLIALLEKSVVRRGWTMAQALVQRAREASLRLARILDASRADTRANTRNIWKPALGMVSAFSLLCLALLPRIPQFVAFAPNPAATYRHSVDFQSAAFAQSDLPLARVIPAALRISASGTVRKNLPRPATRVVPGPPPQQLREQHSAPQVAATRWRVESQRNPAEIVNAKARQTVAPEPEMLLLVRTTQRVGPNSWMWSVSVWRVIVANPPQETPVASKT